MSDEGASPRVDGGFHREGRAERPDSMRRRNLAYVIGMVLREGAISRAELARATGLSAPTVTALVGPLIDGGLLKEMPPGARVAGRPRIPLSIDGDRAVVRGISVGVRASGVSVVGLDATVHASALVPHERLTPEETVAAVAAAAAELAANLPSSARILGTGVTTGGRVNNRTGTVVENELLGWADVPLRTLTAAALPGRVVVEQNVRAAATSELLFGHGRYVDDFAVLLVTSVVGAAIVHGHTVRAGHRMTAGDVAHLVVTDPTDADAHRCRCGRQGCLQAVATDDVLVDDAVRAGVPDVETVFDLLERAEDGDARARDLIERRDRYVGRAAALLMNVVDPRHIVLLGTPARYPLFLEALQEELSAHTRGHLEPDTVVVSDPREHFQTYAAAAPMIQAILNDPQTFLEPPTPAVG